MAIILFLTLAAVAMVAAEPPVNNQYLPPGLQTEAAFPGRGSPNNQYLPPSSQYGAPGGGNGGFGGAPSSQYGTPGGSNGNGFGGRPSSQYGAPGGRPSSQYGAPGAGNGFGGRPSSQYGAPSSQYGAPSGFGQNGGYDDGPSEPANYEFKYDVDAPEYNVKFGHQEARQGDVAQGKYYVLLPDGRTQLVEYVADQDGYRPKISYEGGEGGYGRGPNGNGNGNGGYQYRK
ncbi:hypothetical protein J6590_029936 [Homalodisca vitripennis]|nr:hypothetical protein J6590_029936 [Homalodisca vitripennis]